MGTLYLIATPIGNLEDISYRAIRILGEVDVLACEDTRVTRKLLTHFEIPKPKLVISHHQHNEAKSAPGITKLLDEGRTVALCTDGGYPGISDPGYRLVHDATQAGHEVIVIPGPSAVPTALMVSGLPCSSFLFRGFGPKKSGQRQNFFKKDADLPHTLIYFESPKRLLDFLEDAYEVFGDRQAAICVELTKVHERVQRGFLRDLIAQNQEPIKGEITIVIASNHPKLLREDE